MLSMGQMQWADWEPQEILLATFLTWMKCSTLKLEHVTTWLVELDPLVQGPLLIHLELSSKRHLLVQEGDGSAKKESSGNAGDIYDYLVVA